MTWETISSKRPPHGCDDNLIGLHADLMDAHLLNIRTVLAVTGDLISVSGETGDRSILDVKSSEWF